MGHVGLIGEAGPAWDLWAVAASCGVAVVLVGLSVRYWWFGRLKFGFAAALTLSLVLAGLVTASLLGTYVYRESRTALFNQFVRSLANADRVLENELRSDIRDNVEKLQHLATPELVKLASESPETARAQLIELARFNRRLLQINV